MVDLLSHYLLFQQTLCHLQSLTAKILCHPLAFISAVFYSTMQYSIRQYSVMGYMKMFVLVT